RGRNAKIKGRNIFVALAQDSRYLPISDLATVSLYQHKWMSTMVKRLIGGTSRQGCFKFARGNSKALRAPKNQKCYGKSIHAIILVLYFLPEN
ncbi:hypothetical protein, partial [Acaryochloris sp. IP29b_bin.137]|uniref:hypothetical protein n=1 Tax=Acaryochloris sp. IP29b_bin.137 TaxID=2969217 RepID=UPI0026344C68